VEAEACHGTSNQRLSGQCGGEADCSIVVRLGVPHTGEDSIDAETAKNPLELSQTRTKVGLELCTSISNDVFREPVRFERLLEDFKHTLSGLIHEPSATGQISAMVIQERMEVDEPDSFNDDSVHDIDLPTIVRFRVFEILVRFERFWLLSIFSVFRENTPDGLSMIIYILLPEEVPYFPSATASSFPFHAQNGLFRLHRYRMRFAPRPISQSFDAMFVISLDIILDRSPGITEPSAGLMEREVSSLDREHEPQTIEYILVLEHGFHLDHRRGQGAAGLLLLARRRFRVTKGGRFRYYITGYGYHG